MSATARAAGHDDRLTPAALYRAVLPAFALVVVLLLFPTLASVLLLGMLVVLAAIPLSAGEPTSTPIRATRSGSGDRPPRWAAGIAGVLTSLVIVAITALYTSICPDPLTCGAFGLFTASPRRFGRAPAEAPRG